VVQWRRWNNTLHRDVGYLVVALTLVYGISGLAINHMADWNPAREAGPRRSRQVVRARRRSYPARIFRLPRDLV